jgi:hypothetical protein
MTRSHQLDVDDTDLAIDDADLAIVAGGTA